MAFIVTTFIILMNIHFFQPKEFIFDREFLQTTSPGGGCTRGSIGPADAATIDVGLFRMLISLAMAAGISILM